MSRAGVERVRGGYDAFNRGDVEVFLDGFHPDIEWYFNPRFLDRADSVLRGLEGMRRYLAEDVDAIWRDYHAEPEEVHDFGSHIFVVARFQGLGRESGVTVDLRLYDVFTMRDDRAVRRDSYSEREDALEALRRAGLEP